MNAKDLIKNKSLCVLPWSGFQLEPNGDVKNCIISRNTMGNIHQQAITDIIEGEANRKLRQDMLEDNLPSNCAGCHLQEKHRKDISSISSRKYYLAELGQSFLKNPDTFKLRHVDLRWSNTCNQACVYCGPLYSSKWAKELGQTIETNNKQKQLEDFIFSNIRDLENVYLAGGEPLLMKQNKKFLQELLRVNPDVHLRINTNLSKTDTGIFDLLCQFKHVHWTISVEAIEAQYEYIRHHGSWNDFSNNLDKIKKLPHKISFNMLYFALNHDSIFETVNYFKSLGYHENSFIIGPLYNPEGLSVLNLSRDMLSNAVEKLKLEVDQSDFYLKNSFENILNYLQDQKWTCDIKKILDFVEVLDKRRGLNSIEIFPCLKRLQTS